MKKIFSFLAVALLSISAMAATITINGSEFTGGTANTGSDVTLTKSGVTVSTDKGYAAGEHLRVYAGGTLNFQSSDKITKIEFEWASGNKYEGPDTETPNATTYSVTATKQMRIAKITVTLDGEGGGTTGGGTTGGGTTGGSTIVINNDFLMVDAYYFDDEDGKGWSFDFYSDFDEETYEIYGEELYFHFFSNKTTSINGTYSIEFGYYFKDDEDEEGVEFTSGTVTIAAKGTKNEYDEPIYQFTATFQAPDGNTYTLNKSFGVYAMNDDGDITLNENGGTTGGGTTGGGTTQEGQTITVAEALAIGGKLADKAETAETYTVVGYVGKIAKDYDAEKKNQCWFMCDDKSEVGSSAYFNFEAYWCYIDAPVALGDYVSVTGKIKKYGNTIEIQNGQAKKISEPTGVKNAELELKAVKSLENGTLIIRRGEKTYNVLGAQF